MNKFTKVILGMALVATALTCRAETKTTHRDAQGRVQGYKQTR